MHSHVRPPARRAWHRNIRSSPVEVGPPRPSRACGGLLLFALVAAVGAAPAPGALAQPTDSAALINQALDRQTSLEASGTLPELMAEIGKKTGVPVEASPQVWEALPWGRDTTAKINIKNQTLRQALTAITQKLGLTFVLKDEAVELQPMPALRRLGRKSTVAELAALDVLASTPLDLKAEKPKLKDLIEAVDLKLEAAKAPVAVVNRSATSPDKVPQDAPIAVARNATLLDALEAIAGQTAATWYPWDKNVIILPKQDQTRRLLQKDLTLRYDGTDVGQVLTELSTRCGVRFTFEPGAIQGLPPQTRNIKLVLSATAIDALEAISGLTGLGYVIKDEEVYVWNTAVAPGGAPRDRAVGMIQTDFGMQLFITESQVPPDVKEFFDREKQKYFENVRQMMAERGFKPKSSPNQPASKPGPPPKPAPPAPKPGEAAPGTGPGAAPGAPGPQKAEPAPAPGKDL